MGFTTGTNISRQDFVDAVSNRMRDNANAKINISSSQASTLNNASPASVFQPLNVTHTDFPATADSGLPFENIVGGGASPSIEAYFRQYALIYSRVRRFKFKNTSTNVIFYRYGRVQAAGLPNIDGTATAGPASLYNRIQEHHNISASTLIDVLENVIDVVLEINYEKLFPHTINFT